MKTLRTAQTNKGSVLVIVMAFLTLSLAVLGASLSWTTANARMTERHNELFRTTAAAEAATEKAISQLVKDYRLEGDGLVLTNMDLYRSAVPTVAENAAWSDYEFKDISGNTNRLHVEFVPPSGYRALAAQYQGLRGYVTGFRLVSRARDVTSPMNITAAVRQDVEIATIPLFQFAIFYTLDLEINPGPVMTVTGPVHSNSKIYLEPQNALTFQSDVTAAGAIIHDNKPGDTTVRNGGTITYNGEHDAGVSTLNLPIGTNNSPAAVRQVVEVPPSDEDPNSPMGKERYYNKADMIITVKDIGVVVNSGRFNNFGSVVPNSEATQFVNTAVTFFNKRENKWVKTTEIDIGKLRQWNQSNTLLRPVLPMRDVRTVYVVDIRTNAAGTQAGVRLVNGETLLPKGLTVVTPHPIYIKGHYNSPLSERGSLDTSLTVGASVVGDAVTILSPAWNDANSASGLGSRVAVNTTVNAALLAGIVQTVPGEYSGGAENFPRFLETWSGKTLTYNGSMVVLFESRYATGLWQGTGAAPTYPDIYNPPNRNWAFDENFLDLNKLPPATPCVKALIRGSWAMVKPDGSG
jgi:hypothetical protein